ncbi:MAG TPA: hypothetical protein VG326_18530 [Tepidisphaeraceae bacterium]|nr:hypothetical protein [Tepidisphaeraceae bacterium]
MAQESFSQQPSRSPSTRGGEERGDTVYSAAELEKLRAERDVLLDRQSSIMELVGSTKPERILHDIRNILNERILLRTLAGIEDDEQKQG